MKYLSLSRSRYGFKSRRRSRRSFFDTSEREKRARTRREFRFRMHSPRLSHGPGDHGRKASTIRVTYSVIRGGTAGGIKNITSVIRSLELGHVH